MPLWGVADNDASEPKNLSTGEFQGTAGKAIFGVDTVSYTHLTLPTSR